jgi:hypothetical protein
MTIGFLTRLCAWCLGLAVLIAAGCSSDASMSASAPDRKAEQVARERVAAERNVRALRAQVRRLRSRQTSTVQAPPAPAGTEEIAGTAASVRSARLLSAADRASFARLSARLAGSEGLAVSSIGRGQPVQRLGSLVGGVAWSTSKVPVGMASIDAGASAPVDLSRAITASDNAAAERLWIALGAGSRAARATDRELRAAGDSRTVTQARRLRPGFTEFGQTMWSLEDQVRFTAGMRCLPSGRRLLLLMGQVVAGQRWGLGSAGVPARFKGGWGPGITPGRSDGWLERQMGIVTVRGRQLAVTIASAGADHRVATRNLTALARWVVSAIDTTSLRRTPAC